MAMATATMALLGVVTYQREGHHSCHAHCAICSPCFRRWYHDVAVSAANYLSNMRPFGQVSLDTILWWLESRDMSKRYFVRCSQPQDTARHAREHTIDRKWLGVGCQCDKACPMGAVKIRYNVV